jgi:hypothetical protein
MISTCEPTVLGPLLFLTYINDMPEMVKSSETKLFADDSLLFRTINNQADSVLLQNDYIATRLGRQMANELQRQEMPSHSNNT